MSTCSAHPEIEATGACEYCGESRCAECLQPLLGRRYCPDCHRRVESLAGGAPAQPAVEPAAEAAAEPARVPEPTDERPRLPGWASALLYLAGFILLIKVIAESLLIVPLLLAKQLAGRVGAAPDPMAEIMDPGPLGLPLWTALFGLFTWGSLLATLLFTGLTAHRLEGRSLAALGLRIRHTFLRDLVAGPLLAGALFLSIVGFGAMQNWYEVRAAASLPEALVIAGAGFLVLLPYAAVEEISMRGYLFHAVQRSWGKTGAVLASTLVFAALHSFNPHAGQSPLVMVGLVLAGLYLVSAYLITGNLWLAIFLHTGWNLMEGPVFGLPVSGVTVPASIFRTRAGGPELWTGGAFGPEAGLLLCLFMAVHLSVLWSLRPLFRHGHGPARVEAG